MEEGLTKIPKLELAQLKFTLNQEQNKKGNSTNNQKAKDELMNEIIQNSICFCFKLI
jgi:hypothetical protein